MDVVGNLHKIIKCPAENFFPISSLASKLGDTYQQKSMLSCLELFTYLIKENSFSDAIEVLAYSLPKRELIWWAVSSYEDITSTKILGTEKEAVACARTWVYQPEEKQRREAEKFAHCLDFKTPGSWLCMAVFWSGGSISPFGQPDVNPDPSLMPKAIFGAMGLTLAKIEPKQHSQAYEKILCKGMSIASGGKGD